MSRWPCARSSAREHRPASNVVEPWEVAIEPRVAAVEERVLLASSNPAGAFAVLVIQRIDDIHPRDHSSKWCKGFLIVIWGVVGQIDEHLRRSTVRRRKCECNGAADV